MRLLFCNKTAAVWRRRKKERRKDRRGVRWNSCRSSEQQLNVKVTRRWDDWRLNAISVHVGGVERPLQTFLHSFPKPLTLLKLLTFYHKLQPVFTWRLTWNVEVKHDISVSTSRRCVFIISPRARMSGVPSCSVRLISCFFRMLWRRKQSSTGCFEWLKWQCWCVNYHRLRRRCGTRHRGLLLAMQDYTFFYFHKTCMWGFSFLNSPPVGIKHAAAISIQQKTSIAQQLKIDSLTDVCAASHQLTERPARTSRVWLFTSPPASPTMLTCSYNVHYDHHGGLAC